MNRPIWLVIILIFVAIVVVGIGFWRNHYLKVINAEPIKVYKDTPLQQDTSSKDTSIKQELAEKTTEKQPKELPKVTSIQSDDGTDEVMDTRETTPSKDNSVAPEETENTANLTVHAVFTDIIVENLPPEATAALKLYDEVQLATPIVNERMKTLFKTEPVDFDALKVETQKLKKLNDQREESLEILAKYSKQASDKLDVLLARKVEAERIIEELDEGKVEFEETVKELEEIGRNQEERINKLESR